LQCLRPIGQEMAEVAQGISQELVTRRGCQVNAGSYWPRDGGSCVRDQPGTGHTSWMPGKCLFLLVKRWQKLPKGSAKNGMVTSSMPGECIRSIGRRRCRVSYHLPGSSRCKENRNYLVVRIHHIFCVHGDKKRVNNLLCFSLKYFYLLH
jgi:hypothetical protein